MSPRIKSFFKKILRLPMTIYRYFVGLFTIRKKYLDLNHRIYLLEQEMQNMDQRLDAMETHLPAILNYITSFSHTSWELTRVNEEIRNSLRGIEDWVGTLAPQIGQLWERIDFVRRETLYELMHGGKAKALRTEARVINQERLAAMTDGIRVYIGFGQLPLEGYLNIDQRELPGVDIVAEAIDMPFEPDSISELFSAHLIEHFSQEVLIRRELPYWSSLLKPGETRYTILPDWETMIEHFINGSYNFEDLREVTFGAQDYNGDFHLNMFSQDSLRSLLKEAGLKDIDFPVTGRVNGKSLEMEVTAVM